jgi:hypothetical protein
MSRKEVKMMGKIMAGILSSVSGKVAGVVGATWKNKAYLRGYVIPANPNTAAQQVQRTKFGQVVDFVKPLVGPVCNAYLDRFIRAMSGFNYLVKQNIDVFDGSPDYMSIILSSGPLWKPVLLTAGFNSVADEVTLTWSPSLGNNGAATDKVYGLAYDVTSGLWGFAAAEVNRSVATMTFSLQVDAGDEVYGFLFACRYAGTTPSLLSDSNVLLAS